MSLDNNDEYDDLTFKNETYRYPVADNNRFTKRNNLSTDQSTDIGQTIYDTERNSSDCSFMSYKKGNHNERNDFASFFQQPKYAQNKLNPNQKALISKIWFYKFKSCSNLRLFNFIGV
jgi:hypothetical protein